MSLSVFETKIHEPVTPQVVAGLSHNIVSTVSPSVLEDRCKLFGKRLVHVAGDGLCQFRALAVVLFGDESRHVEVRAAIVKFLRDHQSTMELPLMEGIVVLSADLLELDEETSVNDWIDDLEEGDEWGNSLTLCIAMHIYGRSIRMITPAFQRHWWYELEHPAPTGPTVFLAMTSQSRGQEHYAAVVDLPSDESVPASSEALKDFSRQQEQIMHRFFNSLTTVRLLAPPEIAAHLDNSSINAPAPINIGLFGATGAGKSTLLNKLVGVPVSMEGSGRAVTAAPIAVSLSKTDKSTLQVTYISEEECADLIGQLRDVLEAPESDESLDVALIEEAQCILASLTLGAEHNYKLRPEIGAKIRTRHEIAEVELTTLVSRVSQLGATQDMDSGSSDDDDDADNAMHVDSPTNDTAVMWPIVAEISIAGAFSNSALLPGVTLVDCPGYGDVSERRELIANRAAASCTTRIIVVDHERGFSTPAAWTAFQQALNCGAGNVAVAITKIERAVDKSRVQAWHSDPSARKEIFEKTVRKLRKTIERAVSDKLKAYYHNNTSHAHDGAAKFSVSKNGNLEIFFVEEAYAPSYEPLKEWIRSKSVGYAVACQRLSSMMQMQLSVVAEMLQHPVGADIRTALAQLMQVLKRKQTEKLNKNTLMELILTVFEQNKARLITDAPAVWDELESQLSRVSWGPLARRNGTHRVTPKHGPPREVRMNAHIAQAIREPLLESPHFANFFAALDALVNEKCDEMSGVAVESLSKNKNAKHIVNMIRSRCATVAAELSEQIARTRQFLSDNLLQTVLDCMTPVYKMCKKKGKTGHNAEIKEALMDVVVNEDGGVFSQVIDALIKNMETAVSACETRIQKLAGEILTQMGHLNEAKALKKNDAILAMLKSPIQSFKVQWAQSQTTTNLGGSLAALFAPLQAISPLFFASATTIPVCSKRPAARGRLAASPHASGFKLHITDDANHPLSIVVADAHLGLELCLWILNQYSCLNFVDVPGEALRVVFDCVAAFLEAVPSTLTTGDFTNLFQEEQVTQKKRKRSVAATSVKAEKKPKTSE